MSEPNIYSDYAAGSHNTDLQKTINRLKKDMAYKDLSTIIITPATGAVPVRVIQSWESLMTPPNNKVVRLYAEGAEVGVAYSTCIEGILNHPDMKNWKYVCFREHDNILPPDGLIKLLRQMEDHPEFDAISAIYFTKGHGGHPQIWGDPKDPVLNFRPQLPIPNIPGTSLVECNGTGMGFAIFRLKMFKDKNLRRPWFNTTASKEEGCFSQDLYAWSDLKKNGYRCAVDVDCKVGHYDHSGIFGEKGKVW